MRTVPMGKLINLSIERMMLILFRPFSFKKWLCLLLIAWLAGASGGCSGGGGGGSSRSRYRRAEAAQAEYGTDEYYSYQYDQDYTVGDSLDTRDDSSLYDYDNDYFRDKSKSSEAGLGFSPLALGFGFLALAAILLLPLIILFIWLGARFKFIWFNSIVNNDPSIVEPFGRYKAEGNSLFKFYLVLFLITMVFFGILFFWIISLARAAGMFPGGSFFAFLGAFLFPGMLFILGVIVLAILYVAIDHFVVTIMAIEHCSFKPAWQKFINILSQNIKEFLFYLLIVIGLGILCILMAFCLILILILVILLIGAILFGLPYLLFVGLLKAMPLFVVFAIIAGIPFIATAILLIIAVNLPFAVFFRSFSLYFFSSLKCGYNPLALEG